jgi:hypothetical protein
MTPHETYLALIMLDFREAFAQDKAQALSDLLLLVTNPNLCLRRVACLRAARRHLNRPVPPRPVSDLTARPEGLFGVIAEELTPAQVEELHLLSCDPDALWNAHRVLCAAPDPQPDPSPVPVSAGSPYGGLTLMARDPNGIERVLEALAEYAPFWMEWYGLPAERANDFLAFVRTKLPIGETVRFRDSWPVWLTEFASIQKASRSLTSEELWKQVPRLGWQKALTAFASTGAPWKKKLKDILLARTDLAPQDIESLPLDARELGTDNLTLTKARRDLSWDIEQAQQHALRVHDLASD